ncbi:hypothetical protein Tco_0848065 [Tanacetum coccineum]
MGTLTQVCVRSCPNISALAGRPFSVGRPATKSLGGGTGVRVGRGGRGRRPRGKNGNVVIENVQENVGNVIVNGNRVGCSYKEFLACNPKEYDSKEGVVVLTRWIKKMEYMHDTSGCSINQKVKYTAGSFVDKALMWWNSQMRMLSRAGGRKLEELLLVCHEWTLVYDDRSFVLVI